LNLIKSDFSLATHIDMLWPRRSEETSLRNTCNKWRLGDYGSVT